MHSDKQIVQALQAAAKAHRTQTGKHYEADHNWADWYANFLLSNEGFKSASQRDWANEDLAQALRDLHESYAQTNQHHSWARYYAARLEQ